MARIRTIKPDFFFDEKITELDHKARLAFIGLWCYADKEGKMEDKPKVLKAKLFPYENVDFDKILTSLADINLISRYTIEDCNYLIVNNFQKHQRPHHTEKTAGIPDFNGVKTVKYPSQDGEQKEGKEGKGKEGKGKERKGRESDPPVSFKASDSLKEWCIENNLSSAKLKELTESCFDYFRSKGVKRIDWEATLRNWIRKDKQFNPTSNEPEYKQL